MFGKRKLAWKVSLTFLATIIPLILLLVLNNLYSINRSNELLAESNHHTVMQWSEQIDDNLRMLERSMASIAYVESDFSAMGRNETELNVYLATYSISQRLYTMINGFSCAGGLFVYSPEDNAWADRFRDGQYSYAFRKEVRKAVRNLDHNSLPNATWTVLNIGGKNVLFYVLYRQEARIAAMVDFDLLVDAVQDAHSLLYMDREGNLLSGDIFHGGEPLIQTQDDGQAYLLDSSDKEYLSVWTTSQLTGIRVVLAVSNAGYWDGLTGVQTGLVILSLLALLLTPFVYFLMKKNLNRPLDNLTEAMNKIRRGELQTQITEDFYFDELEEVKQTFNAMMSEVSSLKIEVYEHELERQRVELQYRQGQLRPHFFLNCLKNIHALAQRGKTDQIQEMVLATSDYLRYLFRDSLRTVSLREELSYVQDYIRIQCLSRAIAPICEITADESLYDIMIPPLSVEAFVENAVKHHGVPNRGPEIRVRIVLLESEDERYLDITVRDHGGGISEEQLHVLNDLGSQTGDSGHIGLVNLSRRLKLLYGDRAALAFYNEGDGAVSEMICPILEKEENA